VDCPKRGVSGPFKPFDASPTFRDHTGVICPYCDANDDKVIDSRASDGGRVIRRRRECLKCGKRFTTYERTEQAARLTVAKHDGRREPFRRENVLAGVEAACGKRPIPEPVKQRLVDEVEEELHREFDREVPSAEIGRRVMVKLRDIDEVAYIRFASEYLNFRNGTDIRHELEELDKRVKDVKAQQALF
jgi:transcriptional repressor NrdR